MTSMVITGQTTTEFNVDYSTTYIRFLFYVESMAKRGCHYGSCWSSSVCFGAGNYSWWRLKTGAIFVSSIVFILSSICTLSLWSTEGFFISPGGHPQSVMALAIIIIHCGV